MQNILRVKANGGIDRFSLLPSTEQDVLFGLLFTECCFFCNKFPSAAQSSSDSWDKILLIELVQCGIDMDSFTYSS